MRKLGAFFLSLWLCSSMGCANYLMNRANDALDMIHLKAAFGPGILASVRVTQGLTAGLGVLNHVQKYGIKGRGIGHWEEYRGEAGGMFMGIPLSFYYVKDVRKTFVAGNSYLKEDLERPKPDEYRVFPILGLGWWPLESNAPGTREAADKLNSANPFMADRKITEVGATAHLLIIGVDVSIDLLEVFDFLLGWFTLDFRGDDGGSEVKEHKNKEWGEDDSTPKAQAKK